MWAPCKTPVPLGAVLRAPGRGGTAPARSPRPSRPFPAACPPLPPGRLSGGACGAAAALGAGTRRVPPPEPPRHLPPPLGPSLPPALGRRGESRRRRRRLRTAQLRTAPLGSPARLPPPVASGPPGPARPRTQVSAALTLCARHPAGNKRRSPGPGRCSAGPGPPRCRPAGARGSRAPSPAPERGPCPPQGPAAPERPWALQAGAPPYRYGRCLFNFLASSLTSCGTLFHTAAVATPAMAAFLWQVKAFPREAGEGAVGRAGVTSTGNKTQYLDTPAQGSPCLSC